MAEKFLLLQERFRCSNYNIWLSIPGEDDLKKGTQLLEIYALEIQMYTAQKNNKKLKALYDQSLHIKSAIPHPLILGKSFQLSIDSDKVILHFENSIEFLFTINLNLINTFKTWQVSSANAEEKCICEKENLKKHILISLKLLRWVWHKHE